MILAQLLLQIDVEHLLSIDGFDMPVELRAVVSALAKPDIYNMLPIEFFLFGEKTKAIVIPRSERQFAWPAPQPDDPMRLSDQCPSSLKLSLP